MDTQTAYHHGYNQEHDPNVVGHHHEGEDENDHHEKKSVLKKVKEKAKKIKNTIKKHGHGHDHDHGHEGHIPDDHDLDEEDDDDDEEDIVDPEVHGAPMYDSAAAKSAVYQQPEHLSRPGIKAIHPDTPVPRDSHFYSGSEKTKFNNEPAVNPVTGIGALVTEQPKVNFGKQTAVSNDPLIASQNTPVAVSRQSRDADPSKTFVQEYPGQPKVNLQRPKGLEEDPAAPKDTPGAYTTTNYQTKVTDPTGKGGEVTGITPILHSFDKMNIHGTGTQDTGLREQNFPPGTHQRLSDLSFPTGSHDQFSPQPTAPSRITKTPENSPLVSETVDTSKPHEEQLRSAESDKPSNQSSYTEKISSATSAIADKAVSAKNIVASKLGYGEKEQNLTPTNELHESTQDNTTKQSSSAMDYGKKIAGTVTGTLSPVYQKVAEAGSSVISKLPGTGTGTGTATEVGTDELQGQDKGVSMTGYISEKLKPGEEDKALSEFLTEAWNPQKEEPEKENKPRGKVTESVEVTRRLGAADKGYERADSVSDNSTSKGMVDKIKGTVGSWFGKTEEPQQQQQQANVSSSDGNEDYTSSTYERKLQESGN